MNRLLHRTKQGANVWLPAVLLALCYIFQAKGLSPSAGRQLLWQLGMMVLLVSMLYHNSIWKLIFYYCVLQLIITSTNSQSLSSLFMLWSIGIYGAIVWHWGELHAKHWYGLFTAIWILSFYSILARIFDWPTFYYVIEGVRHLHFTDYAGAFTHTVYQGIFSAMLIPFFLFYAWYLLPIAIFTMMGAHCSIAVIGLGLAFCYLSIQRLKWNAIPIIIALATLVLAYNVYYDKQPIWAVLNNSRINYWIKLIQHTGFTWFGNGLGSFKDVVGVIANSTNAYNYDPVVGVYINAHNFIIQWYYETGVVGIGLLVSYGVYLTKLIIKVKCLKIEQCLVASLIVSVVSTLWQPSFYLIEIGIPTVIIAVLLERRLRCREE